MRVLRSGDRLGLIPSPFFFLGLSGIPIGFDADLGDKDGGTVGVDASETDKLEAGRADDEDDDEDEEMEGKEE